jgi:hypothetical protein
VTSSMPSTVGQCVWTGPEPAIGHLRPPLTPTVRGDREALGGDVDLVLVVVVFARDTDLLLRAGAQIGARGAVTVDELMATSLPPRLGGRRLRRHSPPPPRPHLPSAGTTAHKQGRVAGAILSAAKPDSLAASAPKS